MPTPILEDAPDLKEIADKIVERYSIYLPKVETEVIYFAEKLGEKPKKAKVLEVSGINSAWVKKQLEDQQNDKRYCISIWGSEWMDLGPNTQQWALLNALLMLSPKMDGTLRKPDVLGFGFILEYMVQNGFGAYWEGKLGVQPLPELLAEDGSCVPIPLPPCDDDEGSSTDLED